MITACLALGFESHEVYAGELPVCESGFDQTILMSATTVTDLLEKGKDLHCEVTPSRGMKSAQNPEKAGLDGTWKVSPLWGQHAIGADLVSEFIVEKLKSAEASRVPTGILDVISEPAEDAPIRPDALRINLLPKKTENRALDHGNQAASLASAPVFGVSPAITWSALVNLNPTIRDDSFKESWNTNLENGLKAVSETPTRLVTASIGLSKPEAQKTMDSFVDSGKILIQSAGNSFPVPAQGANRLHTGHLIAGSAGPNGLPSPFSSEPVSVYAPSDNVQLSGPNDEYGGTSGAAPLVAGSIANALALRPSLTNAETEILLKETSLPSFPNFGSSRPGIVNAYRLAIVAACLQERNEPASKTSSCFDQSSRATALARQATAQLGDPSCISQRDGLKNLRASFLLNPTKETANRLAEIYKQLGYPGDARWYRTMSVNFESPEQQRRYFQELLDEPSLGSHRYFAGAFIGEKARGFYAFSLAARLPRDHEFSKLALAKIKSDLKNKDRQNAALYQATILGPRALPVIEPYLVDSKSFDDPRSAFLVITRMIINDGEPHPWIEETKSFFKGRKYEKYLRSDSN